MELLTWIGLENLDNVDEIIGKVVFHLEIPQKAMFVFCLFLKLSQICQAAAGVGSSPPSFSAVVWLTTSATYSQKNVIF